MQGLPRSGQDSTKAIQKAIDDGKRCGANCNGSTTKNAIVYFPPGEYLVSSSISVHFGTQIIGDAQSWPTIRAASSFIGLGVLSTDVYVEQGGTGPDGNALEWYVNTARFHGQIRNLKVDIRATDPGAYVCAFHYQVAQATTIENIEIIANSATVCVQAISIPPMHTAFSPGGRALTSLAPDPARHLRRERQRRCHVRHHFHGWQFWYL